MQFQTAIMFAEWGFPVFPLQPKSKIPFKGTRGHLEATTDLDQIVRWWTRVPDANIASRPRAGYVVVDIDPRHGGMDTWTDLTEGHEVAPTFSTFTGSGGWHLWYKHTSDRRHRKEAGAGIDLKTDTGYLVMPSSIHPDTGKFYQLHNFTLDIPLLPDCLYDHVYVKPRPPAPARRKNTVKKGDGLIRVLLDAQEGNRNSMLFWAACTAAQDGLDLEGELFDAARSIGLSDREIAATINSANQKVMGSAA